MLWSEGGAIAWLALVFNTLGAVFTSDICLQLLADFSFSLRAPVSGFHGQMLTVLFRRPAPLILLSMGIFYLWVYVQRSFFSKHRQAES